MRRSVSSTYQNTYNLLLQNKNLQQLSSFRQRIPRQIYQTAQNYPSFFNSNLVSPGRVIKILIGPNSIVKGFYYQLMKICFEIQVAEIDYIDLLKSKIFDPKLTIKEEISSSPISGQLYSDAQYKKFIAQFIELLISQSIPNFQLTINEYPIIDQALEKTFQAFLTKSKKKFLDNQQKLQFLSEMFHVGFIPYGKCFKFDESDVFLYEQKEEQIYMAYLNEMEEVSEADTSDPQRQEDQEKQYNLSHLEIPNQQSQSEANKSNDIPLEQPQEMSKKNSKHSYTQSQKISDIDKSNSHNIQNIKNSSLINMVQEVSNLSLNDSSKMNENSQFENDRERMNAKKSKQNKNQQEERYQKPYKTVQNNQNIRIEDSNKVEKSENLLMKAQHDTFGDKYQKQFNRHISEVESFNLQYNSPNQSKASQVQLQRYNYHVQRQQIVTEEPKQQSSFKPYLINIRNPSSTLNLRNISNNQPYQDRLHQTYNIQDMVVTEQRVNYSNLYKNTYVDHKIIDKKSEYRDVEEQLIYRPKKLNTITQLSSFKEQTTTNFHRKNGYQLDPNESDSKGTFYRQFTTTKILQFVKQPHRTKIKIMKNRFIGVRTKNLMNKF